jgi:two-component system sensor histidine kinase YesM
MNVELAEYEKLLLSMRLDRSLHDQIKRTNYENYTDFSVKIGELGIRVRSAMSACAYIPQVKLYLVPEYPYELPPDELVLSISDASEEVWMQQALQSNRSQLTWSTYAVQVSESSTRTMLRATIPIMDRDNGNLLAVVNLQQRMQYVISALPETIDLDNGQLYILDNQGQLIYGNRNNNEVMSVDEAVSCVLPPVEELAEQQGIVDLENYTLFATYDTKRDWHILYITDANLFMERNLQFGQRTLSVLVLTILLSLGMIFITSDVVTRRLRKLTAAVKTVDEKTLTVDFVDDGKDEVSDLYRAFSKLLQRVRNLIDRNQRIEQEKYALELQTLQEQIAPHFLYNTLSSINAMARDI